MPALFILIIYRYSGRIVRMLIIIGFISFSSIISKFNSGYLVLVRFIGVRVTKIYFALN